MIKKKYDELSLGIIITAVGLIYSFLISTIPKKAVANAVVDATTLPKVLAFTLLFLGVLQLGIGFKKVKTESNESGDDESKEEKPSYITVLKTMVIIVVYVALLADVGFLIMTALCLFAQFIVLTPVDKKKNYLVYAIIAVVSSIAIYIAFRNGLSLMLPEGILG